MSSLPNIFVRIIAGLGVILLFASNASAQPSPATNTIREKTENIFKRPEFKPGENNRNKPRTRKSFESEENSKEEPINRNRESAPSQEPSTPETASGSGGLFGLGFVQIVGLLLAIGLVVFIVMSVFKSREPVDADAEAKKNEEVAIVAQRAWLSENYRAQAKHLAEAGDYIEAIRFLFLALVYRFDESGRVSFHKEYTNREYLDLLSDRRNVRDLRLIVDILDDYWYGQQPCEREQYDECLRVYERLVD
jgi:hypothetical protein